jgi:chaperonin GroES
VLIFSGKGEKMKITPLADRVLVKPVEQDEVKKGGIIIPDTAKEKPQEGEVMEVGKGRIDESSGKRIEMEVKKGDRVLYGKYSGTEITFDNTDYLILRESDILAKI